MAVLTADRLFEKYHVKIVWSGVKLSPSTKTVLYLYDLPLLLDIDSVAGSTGYYFALGSMCWDGWICQRLG